MEFEIHITVKNNGIDKFIQDCKELGLKPVLIEAGCSNQLMTSSKHSNKNFFEVLVPLCDLLIERNYSLLRLKVEKKPESTKDENFSYYESHIRLKLPKDFNYDELKKECLIQNFHLSKNLFKKDEDFNYQMITYRMNKGCLTKFNLVINKMTKRLNDMGINYDKIEIEECIYDTNENLDKEWITN